MSMGSWWTPWVLFASQEITITWHEMSRSATRRKWFMGQPRALASPQGALLQHPVRKLNQRAETNITPIRERKKGRNLMEWDFCREKRRDSVLYLFKKRNLFYVSLFCSEIKINVDENLRVMSLSKLEGKNKFLSMVYTTFVY